MAGRSISGTQAFLVALGGVPLKEPIVDQEPLGDYWVRKGVFISAGFAGGFPVAINLPRKPSFFFATSENGAVIYWNGADKAASTPSTIFLRARNGTSDLISTNIDLIVG